MKYTKYKVFQELNSKKQLLIEKQDKLTKRENKKNSQKEIFSSNGKDAEIKIGGRKESESLHNITHDIKR